jgi:hypothetical protein
LLLHFGDWKINISLEEKISNDSLKVASKTRFIMNKTTKAVVKKNYQRNNAIQS